MWEAVALADRPVKFKSTVVLVCAAFSTTVPKPVPAEPLAGFLLDPRRIA